MRLTFWSTPAIEITIAANRGLLFLFARHKSRKYNIIIFRVGLSILQYYNIVLFAIYRGNLDRKRVKRRSYRSNRAAGNIIIIWVHKRRYTYSLQHLLGAFSRAYGAGFAKILLFTQRYGNLFKGVSNNNRNAYIRYYNIHVIVSATSRYGIKLVFYNRSSVYLVTAHIYVQYIVLYYIITMRFRFLIITNIINTRASEIFSL